MKKFDVIVIGAGSGIKISSEASAKGLKTAIIEDARIHPALPEVVQRAFANINF